MGLRYRKSVNLGGKSRINISKSGASFSAGGSGHSINIGKNGVRQTIGIPGTGLSYSKRIGGKSKGSGLWIVFLLLIAFFPIPITILLLKKENIKPKVKYGLIAATWLIYIVLIGAMWIYGSNAEEKTPEVTDTKSGIVDITEAPVESISIECTESKLYLGDSVSLSVTVQPENAHTDSIVWSSSDENILKVDKKGIVNAVGGGSATITASTDNGVEASVDLTVDSSKRTMSLYVTHSRKDNVNIGKEWSFINKVNGKTASGDYTVSVGDTLNFYSKYMENDSNPDIGEASKSYTVKESDLKNGFSVPMDLYVEENGGRNSGEKAHFIVTYEFSAK